MIDFCLLGCGGGMPMPFRSLSASILNIKGRKILIDCGEGTQISMRLASTGFKSIDVICITHCHGDHIVGLPGLLSTIGNSGRIEPLTIIGPQGITEIIKGLMVLNKYLPYEIAIVENPKKLQFEINKTTISPIETNGDLIIDTLDCDHSSPCLGYSFYLKRDRKFSVDKALENNVPKLLWSVLQKNKDTMLDDILYTSDMVLGDDRIGIKLTLITDSRPLPSMINFISNSDLFVCEGTYGANDDLEKAIKNKHMTFKEAASLAKEGNVKKLLLTHFTPAMMDPKEFLSNATDVFSDTLIGEDRLSLTLAFPEE